MQPVSLVNPSHPSSGGSAVWSVYIIPIYQHTHESDSPQQQATDTHSYISPAVLITLDRSGTMTTHCGSNVLRDTM